MLPTIGEARTANQTTKPRRAEIRTPGFHHVQPNLMQRLALLVDPQ